MFGWGKVTLLQANILGLDGHGALDVWPVHLENGSSRAHYHGNTCEEEAWHSIVYALSAKP